MRVIVSGGGTGGHVYPALSTAEAMRPHLDALLYLGSATGPERDMVQKAGWTFAGLPAAPLKRSVAGMARAAGSASVGWIAAAKWMSEFKPDVVIATGGYAAAAAGLNYEQLCQRMIDLAMQRNEKLKMKNEKTAELAA